MRRRWLPLFAVLAFCSACDEKADDCKALLAKEDEILKLPEPMQPGYAIALPAKAAELRAIALHGKMLTRYRDDYAAELEAHAAAIAKAKGTALTERVAGVDTADPDALRKSVAAVSDVEEKKKATEAAIKSWCAGTAEK